MAATATAGLRGLEAARSRAAWWQRGMTIVTFGAIYLVLARVLHPDLILSRTTAAGGDMGSHHYIAQFLEHDLLPHGRVTGWAPGWYAGLPMLTFYFPLPYLLIAALGPLLGDQVAFKLISASGPFLLPLTCWAAFRVLRLRQPAPLLAAAATLPFLTMTCAGTTSGGSCPATTAFEIYGGNIASTMAGEFPFALSFALLPLALALTYRWSEEGRGRRIAAIAIAAVVLSHILTTILLLVGALFLLTHRPARALRVSVRLAVALGVAFCLSAFWAVPFIVRRADTARFGWTQLTDAGLLAPEQIRVFGVLALLGLVVAVRRGHRPVLFLAWPAIAAALLYLLLPHIAPKAALWNARMLPFVYLFAMLVAAYGGAELARWVAGRAAGHGLLSPRHVHATVVLLLVVAMVSGGWAHRATPTYWAQYNYEGFEAKAAWPEAKALFATLDRLPQGRVMWEYSGEFERFGTTRTLENIPVFTRQDSMEGLLIESSINAPFHFINQAETSATATQAVPGIAYPGFDFARGLRHLGLYGVRWFVAYTDKVNKAAKAAGLRPSATSGHFTVYQLGTGSLVEVPAMRPVLTDVPDWRPVALAWYRNASDLETPLAFAARTDRKAVAAFGTHAGQPLEAPGPVADAHMVGTSELDFTTDRVGQPHIVKVSWFPNWHAVGAEGPWLLSPGLMVVVPTQAHVRLVYGDTWAERLGKALSLAGLLALLPPAYVRRARRWRGRRTRARDYRHARDPGDAPEQATLAARPSAGSG